MQQGAKLSNMQGYHQSNDLNFTSERPKEQKKECKWKLKAMNVPTHWHLQTLQQGKQNPAVGEREASSFKFCFQIPIPDRLSDPSVFSVVLSELEPRRLSSDVHIFLLPSSD
ncbi:hypothetical protein C1H46_032839 [Malus baccata]|uniref:Uncharacterized protein n=1 Tax=Malus baccata TaxID=106549 RepID=A0A540L544_MALBA|nr:hypothetical protein C1H46_032839 [Malus baccata]